MKTIKFYFILGFLLLAADFCYSEDTFDYSKIATHPRLLLNEADEARVRQAINTNPQLESIHNYIVTRSNNILSQDVVVYEKSGRRLLAVSREALARVFFLSYTYRMSNEKKYLDRAEAELNAVCNFPDWNPSHFLDVGEMSMAVAIGYDWLFNDLQNTTKENIRRAILQYAFAPSRNKNYNKFLTLDNNWNQVCNSGLVYAALAIFEGHETESTEIIERALVSNPLAMGSYAPDGNHPEGAAYWGLGTSFEIMMIAALESALGSDAGLAQSPGFLKSAEYTLFVNGPTRQRFNYSDCSKNQSSNIPMFWFANKLNEPNLLFEEKKLLEEGLFLKRLDEERLLPAVLIFSQNLVFADFTPPAKKVWSGRGQVPVVMVRADWNSADSEYLGVKGGSASTNHAHMDAGSFVYDSKGLRWAMDFGLQSYITLESMGIDLWNMSQSSQRWEVFRYNNQNHNTITINGKRHNVTGKADLIETYDEDNLKGGKFNMSEIFAGDIISATRKVVLKDECYLEIEDEIVTDNKEAEVRWTMVTPANVNIIDAFTMELTQKNRKKIMTVTSENEIELHTWISDDPGTHYDAKNPGTIMVGFKSKVPANTSTKFTVIIKDGGEYTGPKIETKNDFLSGYSLGDGLEKATYLTTNETEADFKEIWMAKYGNSGGSNPRIIAPLIYDGYIESGVDFAFEVKKASSGARTFGYPLINNSSYNYGTYYLAFMININNDLGINTTDRTRNMIGFSTKFTLDLARVVLSVTKGGAKSGSFKFGIGEKHATSASTYPIQWSSGDYNFGQTYLAVLKYDFSTRKASLFINPVIDETEPQPLLEIAITEDVAIGIAERGIRGISLEQSTVDSRKIGGIRFAKNWVAAIGVDYLSTISEHSVVDKGCIVSEMYFTIHGMRIKHPTESGIYIRRVVYENGSIKSFKCIHK